MKTKGSVRNRANFKELTIHKENKWKLLVLVLALSALGMVACGKKKDTLVMATNAAFPL
jgi:hypothetical protein